MSQLTFQLDQRSEMALKELQETLQTNSKAAALRYALELARIVSENLENNRVVIKNQQGEDIQIAIVGG